MFNYKNLPTGKVTTREISHEEQQKITFCEVMLDLYYDREALSSCINYCKSQVKNSHIPLLSDDTTVGYDSALYHDYQTTTIERLLAAVNKL